MSTHLRLWMAVAVLVVPSANAQTPDEHAAHHPADAASSAAPATAMADMDAHIGAMQAMHDKMAKAQTP